MPCLVWFFRLVCLGFGPGQLVALHAVYHSEHGFLHWLCSRLVALLEGRLCELCLFPILTPARGLIGYYGGPPTGPNVTTATTKLLPVGGVTPVKGHACSRSTTRVWLPCLSCLSCPVAWLPCLQCVLAGAGHTLHAVLCFEQHLCYSAL